MTLKKSWLVFLLAGAGVTGMVGLPGWAVWRGWQSTPGYQFTQARIRWEARPFQHYRMAANSASNRAQCHYDFEVRDERVVHVFGITCLSSAQPQALTVGGIFENFERYIRRRVCSSNGCYCEGSYVVRATYDPTWGYPRRITTEFRRNWLDDLLHGKLGVQQCRRTTPAVEKIDVVTLTPLP